MKTASFYSYLPKRYTTDNVQTERIRRFIYSFKRGDRHAVDANVIGGLFLARTKLIRNL